MGLITFLLMDDQERKRVDNTTKLKDVSDIPEPTVKKRRGYKKQESVSEASEVATIESGEE